MTHVATLIAGATAATLDDRMLASARKLLPNVTGERWLEPGRAADLLFTPDAPAEGGALADALRALQTAMDVVVQPTAFRRKRLLVADMDSTMIEQECIDELADVLGLKDQVAAITERAMRGEIPFEPALRERVALLRGLPATVVNDVLATRISLMPGGRDLVATMRTQGAWTCLVSGGFTSFADPIGARIGFDEVRANRLEVAAGRLSGTVSEPILGRDAKRAALVEMRERLGLKPAETMAVGDGANDLAMIEGAGLGVAFRAKPAVATAAAARIDHADLTALLFMQGYARSEFAAGGA